MGKAVMSGAMHKWSVQKRVQLVDELIVSIADDKRGAKEKRAAEKAMIEGALADIEKHPREGVPLGEFRKELRQLSARMKTRPRRKSA